MTPEARLACCVSVLFMAGALLMSLAHRRRRASAERRRHDWLKYAVYVVVINGLWLSAFVGRGAAALALGLIVLAGAWELVAVAPSSRKLLAAVAAPIALAGALGPLVYAWDAGAPGGFAFVVSITAATDAFAELLGRLCGRRKLCPRLSPEKTVAGLAGGLAMAVVVSQPLGFLLPGFDGPRLALAGLAIALGAVAGDLAFSAIKRRVGVKDFSGLLPAHGGVLDRFDSLVLAAPAFLWSRTLLG
jgi:phosphatidate cytidylyltransferase